MACHEYNGFTIKYDTQLTFYDGMSHIRPKVFHYQKNLTEVTGPKRPRCRDAASQRARLNPSGAAALYGVPVMFGHVLKRSQPPGHGRYISWFKQYKCLIIQGWGVFSEIN